MEIGQDNRNKQRVIAKTEIPGTDSHSTIDIMACMICGLIYAANNTDAFERLCPEDRGRKGTRHPDAETATH